MSTKFLAAFSNTGRYYAHISEDGKLRIWDVNSCTLKQEYTPDVHLTSPFTDLRWITTSRKIDLGSKNRKRKSTSSTTEAENDYLLLGCKSSDVFLYSVSSYSIIGTFKNGHTNRINAISWCCNVPDVFFTCSEDHFVVQWNIENYSIKRKWKCGKVSCLAVSDDGKSVITAKRELKWWNISGEKETSIKTFIGHSTDVISLVFIRISNEACVLSAANGNRLIHAWLLDSAVEDRCALATFAMDDALISLSVHTISLGGTHMLASSRTGVLQLYQCTKNGKKHVKPVKPKLSIQIAAESNNQEKAHVDQIPVVGATFCDENSAYIAYGTDNIISFEKLDLNSSEKCMFIIRQDPRKKLSVTKEQSANKILATSSSKNVQYVPPDAVNGFFPPSSPKKTVKRGSAGEKNNDVPLEQRLENLIVDVPSTMPTPSSDSFVHLLLQGLKSKDTRILQDVIQSKEDKVIKTTINRLPVEAIKPLSLELISMLQGKRSDSDSAVKWLRCILTVHAAHLISDPDITEIFAPVFPFIESRLNVIGPLYKLVGRLDMMIEQIKHRTEESERSLQHVSLQPKFIYQDEDSDDDDEDDNEVLKEDTISNDDSDDHWDEISEIDVDSGQEQNQDIEMDNPDL